MGMPFLGESSSREKSHVPSLYLDIHQCSGSDLIQFNGTEGYVNAFINKDIFNGTFSSCSFQISVPQNMYLKAYGQILQTQDKTCNGFTVIRMNDQPKFSSVFSRAGEKAIMFSPSRQALLYNGKIREDRSALVLLPSNTLYILVEGKSVPVDFFIYFKAERENALTGSFLTVKYLDLTLIVLPGFMENLDYPAGLRLYQKLRVEHNFAVMLSFERFKVHKFTSCKDFFELGMEISDNATHILWRRCGYNEINAYLFNSTVVFYFESQPIGSIVARPFAEGIKIKITYHPLNESIIPISEGLFNCSQHYETFRPHLDCNVRRECEGGEDETETCPYTSYKCPPEALFIKDKCVTLHTLQGRHLAAIEARRECQSQGRDLATFKTQDQMDALRYLLDRKTGPQFYYIGLQIRSYTHVLYRRIWFWLDGTPDYYNGNISYSDYSLHFDMCAYISRFEPMYMYMLPCVEALYDLNSFMCEQKLIVRHTDEISAIQFSAKTNLTSSSPILILSVFVECKNGDYTHGFLSCDPKSRCKSTVYLTQCALQTSALGLGFETNGQLVIVEMFECDKYGDTIHYTMVCDFRRDCSDGSDEIHCKHREQGSGFRCSYGQWIADNKVCDMRDDCLDGSDEQLCDNYRTENTENFYKPQPPVLIHMDGHGSFTMEAMDPADPTCPETHFPCPGEHLYCLPVYLRCNGVKDCLGGEDEVSCDDITCPGYYRCRSSSVCLHVSHVCDGWPQCPERDDELLCNATCPLACYCQGLAFVCHQPFPASRYPDLRYLDATGSGMVPEDVGENFYLLYLRLASCGLTLWPNIHFPNLRGLHLQNNKIVSLSIYSLTLLENLRTVQLMGNPLLTLVADNETMVHQSLSALGLEHTTMKNVNISTLSFFAQLEQLNMSFSSITTISDSGYGLSVLTGLKVFDVRGCNIEDFPGNLLKGLTQLSLVYAKNYKLCCKASLPEGFDPASCFAERDEISSCDDLLRSDNYRVFLWVIAGMSLCGNAASLIIKVVYQRRELLKLGYTVFVFNLSVSDLWMGFYLIIIGSANEIYRGSYLWYENVWKKSIICNIAGLLCLLSYEVSTVIIALITLDRFIVLRYPFSTVRFKGRSAVTASALAWIVGLVLAAVPLLPGLSHWRFYSQTGICIPLPVTRQYYVGRDYSFSILIVLNFVLFLFIAGGQMSIYLSIRSNSIAVNACANSSKNLIIARRLITVVVSDFLCWFPLGVLGLASTSDTPIPGEVSVAVAIFVLPLNSAINPFLYTYNMLIEKRRIKQELKLVQHVRSRMLEETFCRDE